MTSPSTSCRSERLQRPAGLFPGLSGLIMGTRGDITPYAPSLLFQSLWHQTTLAIRPQGHGTQKFADQHLIILAHGVVRPAWLPHQEWPLPEDSYIYLLPVAVVFEFCLFSPSYQKLEDYCNDKMYRELCRTWPQRQWRRRRAEASNSLDSLIPAITPPTQ